MKVREALLLSLIFGLALGVIVAMFAELWEEREFIEYVYRPLDEDRPAAADVSALLEEARRITRDGAGG